MKVLFVCAILLTISSLLKAQDPKWIPLECTAGFFTPAKAIMEALPACADPAVYGPGKLNPNCGYYCSADIFGLLGENGRTSNEIYNSWVDVAFPDQYKDLAKEQFKGCFDKFGGDQLMTEDKEGDCTVGNDFMLCTWEIVPKMPC